jgi:hypothetical protein
MKFIFSRLFSLIYGKSSIYRTISNMFRTTRVAESWRLFF